MKIVAFFHEFSRKIVADHDLFADATNQATWQIDHPLLSWVGLARVCKLSCSELVEDER